MGKYSRLCSDSIVHGKEIQNRGDICVSVPGGKVVKNLPANAGDARDTVLIPRLGRSPGVENGNLLQYSFLENPMGRGAW